VALIAARAEEIGKRWRVAPQTRRPADLAAPIERIDVGLDEIEICFCRPGSARSLMVSAMPLQSVTDDAIKEGSAISAAGGRWIRS
jgi:hypothetical protein